jgi:hypothetical protein
MLQVVYVVPYSPQGAGFVRSNPVYNLVLPVIGGAPIKKVGPFSLPETPDNMTSLGPAIMNHRSLYPITTKPTYFNGVTAAPIVPLILGGIIVMLYPLGADDWLVATQFRVGRITGGMAVWTHSIIPISGGDRNCMVCAIVSSGSEYHLIVKTKPNDAWNTGCRAYYKQIDISGGTDPGLYTGWPSVGIEPDWDTEKGLNGYEAILSELPSFNFAMIGEPYYGGDGVTLDRRAVLVGPATDIAGGKECTGYGLGVDAGYLDFMGQFTLGITIAGGSITRSVRSYSPATYTAAALNALAGAGETPRVGGGTAFLYIGEPPPVPAFWANLRRSTEII